MDRMEKLFEQFIQQFRQTFAQQFKHTLNSVMQEQRDLIRSKRRDTDNTDPVAEQRNEVVNL